MDKDEWQKKGAGHRQRLREKLRRQGVEAFSDDETLEMLLNFGTPRGDCKDSARALLARFGSLAQVLEAPAVELQEVPGVGPKNSLAIQFVHGLARRYLSQRLRGRQYVKSSLEVADYLIHSMRDLRIERLTVIYLDASHGIIDSEIVAEGTLTSNTIYPREIIKKALAQHAAALIIAHNHPSGNSAPSAADRHLTRNLFLALSFIGISLLDHFIVAGSGRPFSFADNGIMAEIKEDCARLDETAGGRR